MKDKKIKAQDFKKLMDAVDIDLEVASSYLPPGAALLKHQYDGRWRSYWREPFRCLPGKSSSWSKQGSEAMALRTVLTETWKQYQDFTGQACPHINMY